MRWTEYAASVLLFGFVSMLSLYLMQRVQQLLPWNPQGFGAVPPALAFNTAASFATNTNWQAYSGETTMSYFTQMVGFAWHNFTSAAVGLAVAIAFIRGVAQKEKDTLGNFWVDLVRGLLYVLLPICTAGALLLVSQGAVARVTRLTHRDLRPGGAFWRDQAQRLLSAYLWSEGRPPENGRLTVHDVSREDLDIAAAWHFD